MVDRTAFAEDNGPSITVAVAQLVERQVVVLDVAGSSPVGYPFRLPIFQLPISDLFNRSMKSGNRQFSFVQRTFPC